MSINDDDEVLHRLASLEQMVGRLNDSVMRLNEEIGVLKGKTESEANLIRWVIFPLLLILAGLVGIKLILPT